MLGSTLNFYQIYKKPVKLAILPASQKESETAFEAQR